MTAEHAHGIDTGGEVAAAVKSTLEWHHHWTIVGAVGDDAEGYCVNQQGARCGWTGPKNEWRSHVAAVLDERVVTPAQTEARERGRADGRREMRPADAAGDTELHAMSGPPIPTPDWVIASWERAASRTAKRNTAADAVLAEARRLCCGENPSANHAATAKHSERMAFAGDLARAMRGQ